MKTTDTLQPKVNMYGRYKTKKVPYNSSGKSSANQIHIQLLVKSVTSALKKSTSLIIKPHMSSLNKRNELASACRHRKKTFVI